MQRTLRFHPALSVAFLALGALVCFGLTLLAVFGNALGGMGDGTSSSAHNDPKVTAIPFAVYFVCGGIAGLIPHRRTRTFLALAAHVSPVWAIHRSGPANMAFLAILALITYGVFSMAWIHMLKDHAFKIGTSPNGGPAEPLGNSGVVGGPPSVS
jgi:hypothetical protein